MFLTVNKDVLTMLMTSLARDASALGSIEVEVEVEAIHFQYLSAVYFKQNVSIVWILDSIAP